MPQKEIELMVVPVELYGMQRSSPPAFQHPVFASWMTFLAT